VAGADDANDRYFTAAGGSIEFLSNEQAVKRLDLAEGSGPVTLDLTVRRGRTAAVEVQDADGRPLSGAVVSGMTAAWPIAFRLSQAKCTLYALAPGKSRVVIFYHPGRKLGAWLEVSGDAAGPLTAKLVPTGAVTGRVLDADGQPIAGAEVNLSFASERPASELHRFLRQQQAPPRTDADGRFKLDGVVPGLKFALNNARKGDTYHVPKPRTGLKEVESGATLDLGDVRTEPLRR
jgi:hypothetical protein